MKKNLRDAFVESLIQVAAEDPKILALDPDVARSTRMLSFAAKYPDRFFEMGVAEQNVVGTAVGLALEGNTVFCVAFAPFMVLRPLEITRTSVVYPRMNVKIVGVYAGVSCSKDGATHQTFEDIAMMRCIPEMIVLSPSDPVMLLSMVKAAAEYHGPLFIRIDSDDVDTIYPEGFKFEIGKGYKVREGKDITLAGYGCAVHRLISAANELEKQGFSAEVLDFASIKPFDSELLTASLEKTGRLLTLEDHNCYGGLTSAVSEVIAQNGIRASYKPVAIMDRFGTSGTIAELQQELGLTDKDVVNAALELLK